MVVRGGKLLKRAAIDFNPNVPARARLVPLQRLDRCECIGWKIIITESQRKRKRKRKWGKKNVKKDKVHNNNNKE
jgi:hypothetical protein